MQSCPCGIKKPYIKCCGKFIEESRIAATPEELMRSRYTAYALAKMDYIDRTMQGAARIGFNKDDAQESAKYIIWSGLTVLRAEMNGEQGSVEFIARYSCNGEKHELHEVSQFQRIGEVWYYVDGYHAD